MKNFFTLRKLFLMVVISLGIIGLVAWKSIQTGSQTRVHIENKMTTIVRVEGLKERTTIANSTAFEMVVRNISPKPISIVTIKQDDEQTAAEKGVITTFGVDGLVDGRDLMPNEIFCTGQNAITPVLSAS